MSILLTLGGYLFTRKLFLTSKHSESLFNDFDVTYLSTQVLPHKRRRNLLNWGGHHEKKHFYWLQASSKTTKSLRSDSILAFSSVYPTINGMYITTMLDTQMCTKRFVFSPNATCCYQMRLWVSMTCFHGDSIFFLQLYWQTCSSTSYTMYGFCLFKE